MHGTAREMEGGDELRFERTLPHPIETVWAALTEPDHLAGWLAPGEIDPRPGGRVHLQFPGGGNVIDATVTEADPPRLLAFPWSGRDGEAGPVRWELSPARDGGTRLVLTHTLPSGAADGRPAVLAAWHMHLDMLAGVLAGRPVPFSRDRFRDLRDHYAQIGG